MSLHATKMLNRNLIFSMQFHTCAITERDITFCRSDLDYACDGEFFACLFRIEIQNFNSNKLIWY